MSEFRWPNRAIVGFVAMWSATVASAAPLEFDVPVVCSGSTDARLELKTEPRVAIAPDGTTVVVWQDLRGGVGGEILSGRSGPADGLEFDLPLRIDDDVRPEIPDWSWQHSSPAVAAAPDGTIYAAWSDRRRAAGLRCPGDEGCGADVYVARSDDGGRSFGLNRRVNDVDDASQAEPDVAVDETGRVHVVWRDTEPGVQLSQIRHAYSDDGGVVWSPSVDLSPGSEALQLDAAIAARGRVVYVVWSDERDGQLDVYATRSDDGGESFSWNARVNDLVSGADRRRPDVAIGPDGRAFVVWEDHRSDVADVWLATNSGGGGQFDHEVRVNDSPAERPRTEPTVAIDTAGRAVVAFRDYDAGLHDPDVRATRSTTGSPPLQFEATVRVNRDVGTDRQSHPDVAVSPATGEIVVVWVDAGKPSGGVDVAAARHLD